MSHDVVVRFSDGEADALRAHKERTDISMSALIRRAVRNELRRPIIDAEPEAPRTFAGQQWADYQARVVPTPEQRRSTSASAVLVVPREQAD